MPVTHDAQAAQQPKAPRPAHKPAAPTPHRGAAQAAPGSAAQLLQLQRQYGNQAAQRLIQREPATEPVIQRAGINDQASYQQPTDILGAGGPLQSADQTPDAELRRQVTSLIEHAVQASADFKVLINEVVGHVNGQIPGGCENGDPGFAHVTKELKGAIDKAQGRMQGKTVADMSDVLRGTVKCKSMQALTLAQEYLDAHARRMLSFTQIKVGGTQKKDGFEPDKRKGQGPGDMVGYGDIKYITPVIHWLASQAPDGGQAGSTPDFWMYAEIQLMTDKMNQKKMDEGGHQFYDLTREVSKTPAGYQLKVTKSAIKGAKWVLADQDDADRRNVNSALMRGVNEADLPALLAKLRQLAAINPDSLPDDTPGAGPQTKPQPSPVNLTLKEVEGMELAGQLVYRRERIAGNIERQGVIAGWKKL